MKLLNPDAGAGAGGGEGVENAFDPNKFKTEILESQKAFQETLMGSMQSMMAGMKTANATTEDVVAKVNPTAKFSEFTSEMEKLGLDDDQTEALTSMVTKLMDSKATGFEKNILTKVDQNADHKEKKTKFESQATSFYPQILDKTSALYRETQRVWNNEMSGSLKEAPDGTYYAIQRAASNLGISPLKIQDIRANDSQNPTGGGGSGEGKRNTEATQKDLDFAAAFGVSPDKFKEKLKLVNSK